MQLIKFKQHDKCDLKCLVKFRMTNLYSVKGSVQAKQRGRFFELADVFLSSGLVPAYTVAAFIKRFARLSLFAPPAGTRATAAELLIWFKQDKLSHAKGHWNLLCHTM